MSNLSSASDFEGLLGDGTCRCGRPFAKRSVNQRYCSYACVLAARRAVRQGRGPADSDAIRPARVLSPAEKRAAVDAALRRAKAYQLGRELVRLFGKP